jgi:hypothetical protein
MTFIVAFRLKDPARSPGKRAVGRGFDREAAEAAERDLQEETKGTDEGRGERAASDAFVGAAAPEVGVALRV